MRSKVWIFAQRYSACISEEFLKMFQNIIPYGIREVVETSYLATLVAHAWTFYMYFNVASNFSYDFLNILRKLYRVNNSLL